MSITPEKQLYINLPEVRHKHDPTYLELQVLRLKCLGRINKQISLGLNMQGRSVDRHLENLRDRLDASTTTEAIAICFRKGYLVWR